MAKIKTILDTRRKLTDNTYPIKFSVFISKDCRFLISSGISVEENQFYCGKIINTPRKDILNNVLQSLYYRINDNILNLQISGELSTINVTTLKAKLTDAINNTPVQDRELTVEKCFSDFIATKTKNKTIEIYKNTLKKIQQYYDKTLTLEEINLKWLKNFEVQLLKEGLAINTISIHLRNIRTIFNNAIDENLITQNAYPFRRFSIKTEETFKRSLTVEQLRQLRDYPCEEHLIKYRDIFMLMFYLIGINAIDLFNNKKSDNIDKGRINYRRSKTGRLYSIKIEPEAQEIINKYKGSKYLIDITEKYKSSNDYLINMDKKLKHIGEVEIGKQGKKTRNPIFPNLSSYWARHTWATIAGELEIPKETIAAALGHGKKDVTDIYIKFNTNKIDEANRKVIDFLNGK